jgi:hypothetical protein
MSKAIKAVPFVKELWADSGSRISDPNSPFGPVSPLSVLGENGTTVSDPNSLSRSASASPLSSLLGENGTTGEVVTNLNLVGFLGSPLDQFANHPYIPLHMGTFYL